MCFPKRLQQLTHTRRWPRRLFCCLSICFYYNLFCGEDGEMWFFVSKNVLLNFVAAVKTQSHYSLSTCSTSVIVALLKPSWHINALQRLISDWTASTLLYNNRNTVFSALYCCKQSFRLRRLANSPGGSLHFHLINLHLKWHQYWRLSPDRLAASLGRHSHYWTEDDLEKSHFY